MSNDNKKIDYSKLTKVYIGSGWSKSYTGKTKEGKEFTRNYVSLSLKGGDERDQVEIFLRDKATGIKVPIYGAMVQLEDARKTKDNQPDKHLIVMLETE